MSHFLGILKAQSNGQNAGGSSLFALVELAILILAIAGMWKTFAKAGQPGWGCIIPIYNLYIMTQIAGRSGWWVLICFSFPSSTWPS